MEKDIVQCHKIKEKLTLELGREPMLEEIAVEAGFDLEKVVKLLQLKVEEKPKENPIHELKFKLTIKNYELEKARLAMGLKQDDVAKGIGIAGVTYSQIECCRNYPDTDRQEKIAKFLGRSVESLFPLWLQSFSNRWNRADKARIVPLTELSLLSPEVLQLESNDYERLIETVDASLIVSKFINKIPPREKAIISSLHGLDGKGEKTLDEVGEEFGVSRERIREIREKSYERIRVLMENPKLKNDKNRFFYHKGSRWAL